MRTSGLQPVPWLRRWPCGVAEPLLVPGGTQGRCEPSASRAWPRSAQPLLSWCRFTAFPASQRSRAKAERGQVPSSRLCGQWQEELGFSSGSGGVPVGARVPTQGSRAGTGHRVTGSAFASSVELAPGGNVLSVDPEQRVLGEVCGGRAWRAETHLPRSQLTAVRLLVFAATSSARRTCRGDASCTGASPDPRARRSPARGFAFQSHTISSTRGAAERGSSTRGAGRGEVTAGAEARTLEALS